MLERADGLGEHEVDPQLPGVERLDVVGADLGCMSADVGTGAGIGVGAAHPCIVPVANSKHVTTVIQRRLSCLPGRYLVWAQRRPSCLARRTASPRPPAPSLR